MGQSKHVEISIRGCAGWIGAKVKGRSGNFVYAPSTSLTVYRRSLASTLILLLTFDRLRESE